MASPQATEAARRAFRERVAALGAVTLPDAATAVGVDEDSLRKWAKQLGSASVFFRGPRNARVCRLEELKAELERWRCTWPEEEGGCDRFALLSKSGRCKRHDAAVPRHGKVFSTEYANARRIDHPDLIARLEADEIPGKRVERSGRPVAWLLDEREADAVLDEHWRCRWHKGCDRHGVGPTRHCNDHAGAATQIANAQGMVAVVCATCGTKREDYPSQLRAGRRGRTDRDPDRPRLCHSHNLASEEFDRKRRQAVADTWAARYAAISEREDGLVLAPAIASEFGLSPTTSFVGSLVKQGVRHERHVVLGVPFVRLDRQEVKRHKIARLRTRDGRVLAAQRFEREKKRLRASQKKRGLPPMSDDELIALEKRCKVRRTLNMSLSPGAPAGTKATTIERNQRWLALAKVVVAWEDGPRQVNPVLRQVFVLDWPQDARPPRDETWPRRKYPADPADPEGPDPKTYRKAEARLRAQIGEDVEALLNAGE